MIDIETLPHDDWMFTPDHLKDESLKEKKLLKDAMRRFSCLAGKKKPVHLARADTRYAKIIARPWHSRSG